jgi:hypothetical protein
MTKTITEKLIARVVGVTDLGGIYPGSTLIGQVGVDVCVEQGSLSIGQNVRLNGPGSSEQVQITGIEMLSNPHDPNVVRILLTKPKTQLPPTGKLEGWTIAEQ